MPTEPYLNVPLDLSEAEEMQEQAQAWAVEMGRLCYAVADTIASRFDQYPGHWRPDHLPVLERVHHELLSIDAQLAAEGHNA